MNPATPAQLAEAASVYREQWPGEPVYYADTDHSGVGFLAPGYPIPENATVLGPSQCNRSVRDQGRAWMTRRADERRIAQQVSDEVNDLRNKLGRVVNKLDHVAVGTGPMMSSVIDGKGDPQPYSPQPTLATVAAEAVEIAEAIIAAAQPHVRLT